MEKMKNMNYSLEFEFGVLQRPFNLRQAQYSSLEADMPNRKTKGNFRALQLSVEVRPEYLPSLFGIS